MEKITVGDIVRDLDDGTLFIVIGVDDRYIPDLLSVTPIHGGLKTLATMDCFELVTKQT